MIPKQYLRIATAFTAVASVEACASAPIPELVAAVAPNPETPLTLSGEALTECRASARDAKGITYPEAAVYDPGITYKAAEIIHRNWKAGSEHATRLRVYRMKRIGKNIFGSEVDTDLVCFYDLREGKLKFLESLIAGNDGRVNQDIYEGAVTRAYRKMSGKNALEAFFHQ